MNSVPGEPGRTSGAIPKSLRAALGWDGLSTMSKRAPTRRTKGAALRRSNFQKHWTRALNAAGLVDHGLHFHDLRHTGNTLTAQSGATLADLMARMGHASTPAASIYLHTSSERDRAVAEALNRFLPPAATGT